MSSGGFSVDTQKQQNKTRQQFCSYVFLVAPFAGGREEQSRGEKTHLFGGFWLFFAQKWRPNDCATFARFGMGTDGIQVSCDFPLHGRVGSGGDCGM